MTKEQRQQVLDHLIACGNRRASADQLRGQGISLDKRYVILQSDGSGEIFWVGDNKILYAEMREKLEGATDVTEQILALVEACRAPNA